MFYILYLYARIMGNKPFITQLHGYYEKGDRLYFWGNEKYLVIEQLTNDVKLIEF